MEHDLLGAVHDQRDYLSLFVYDFQLLDELLDGAKAIRSKLRELVDPTGQLFDPGVCKTPGRIILMRRGFQGKYCWGKLFANRELRCSAGRRRNDFQKADDQGENPFAKGFSPWTLFPKTPIRCDQPRHRKGFGHPHTSLTAHWYGRTAVRPVGSRTALRSFQAAHAALGRNS